MISPTMMKKERAALMDGSYMEEKYPDATPEQLAHKQAVGIVAAKELKDKYLRQFFAALDTAEKEIV